MQIYNKQVTDNRTSHNEGAETTESVNKLSIPDNISGVMIP
jgi:hypothetical protein